MGANSQFDVSENFYGAFWLNSLPFDWKLVPSWTVMRERGEKSREDDVHLTPSQAYGVISQEEYMVITGNKVVLNLTGANDMKHVQPGDFIIHLRSFQGGLEHSAVEGKVSNAYTVLKPVVDIDHGYYKWLFKSSAFISALAGSTDQLRDGQSINFKKFSTFSVPFPPLEAQRRIADFLDKEISEIDTLVGELDVYIELLEKRKDKFLEQQLSQHDWKPCAVGFLGEVLLGKMMTNTPASDSDELLPYLRAAHVQPGGVLDFDVTEKLMWFSPEEKGKLSLHAGDVVVVEGGAGFGRSSYLKSDLDGWGFQNSINRITPDPKKARGEYISIMINRALKQGEIALTCSVATIPHFTAEKLARFRIPLIAIDEQDEFLETVLTEFGRIDSLIKECTELKEILLKRRQVLITDVVTGKVEV